MAADKSDTEYVEMNSAQEINRADSGCGRGGDDSSHEYFALSDCVNRKRQLTCRHGRSTDDDSDPTSGASTSDESEGSNADKASEIGEKRTPLFKVALNKEDSIVALQRTELIDGKPQDPILVHLPESTESYAPGKLPDDFKNGTLWKTFSDMLEDVLCLKRQSVPHSVSSWYYVRDGGDEAMEQKMCCSHQEWVLTIFGDLQTSRLPTVVEYMQEKYGSVIPPQWFPDVREIKRGFLHNPPFSNNVGRQAAYHLLRLCGEIVRLVDMKKWAKTGIRNAGGGALGYEGSTTYAEFVVPTGRKDVAKYLAEECTVPTGGYCKTAVPDGQVFSMKENDDICSNFYLTIEVKPGKQVNDHERVKPPRKTNYGKKRKQTNKQTKEDQPLKAETNAATQTWRQALVGLANSDTSYGVLISPSYARIYQLCIGRDFPGIADPCPEGKLKCLLTSTKTFSFYPVAQNVQELIEAIVCVMLKE